MALSPMYSPAWSIKDARFFTERIISQEKVSSLVLLKWRPMIGISFCKGF